MLVLFSHFGYN